MGESKEEIEKHVKAYRKVFYALVALTILTVAASYVEPEGLVWLAVTIGLAIACVKGGLVAAVFMHLNDEKKLIYFTLALTFFFFVAMVVLILGHSFTPPHVVLQ